MKNSTALVLSVGSAIVIGGSLVWGISSSSSSSQAQSELQAKIDKTNKEAKNYKEKTVIKKVEQSAPDLKKAMDKFQTSAQSGLNLAFGNLDTYTKYNNAKHPILNKLGTSWGNKVITQVQPQDTQEGLFTPSAKVDSIDYSYGKYDSIEDIVPFKVVVKTESKAFNSTAGAGTGYKKSAQSKMNNTYLYEGNFNVSNGEIVLTHSYVGLKTTK